MAKTYQAIASQTLSANSGAITFTNVPQTYTDLLLVAHYRAYSDGNTSIRFNASTATDYSRVALGGSGTAANAGRVNNTTGIAVDFNGSGVNSNFVTSALGGVVIAHIMSYTNTSAHKIVLGIAGAASRGVDRTCSLWRSTAAITEIELTGPSNLASNTVVSLYGIKAA